MFAYALLIFLIAALGSIIIMAVFGMQRNKTLRRVIATTVIGAIVCLVLCMIIGFSIKGCMQDCKAKYTDLMLYYNTVDNSSNEYVRYNYFNKVQEYNEWYTNLASFKDNIFFGNLVHESWLDGCGMIDFQLHGDGYVG